MCVSLVCEGREKGGGDESVGRDLIQGSPCLACRLSVSLHLVQLRLLARQFVLLTGQLLHGCRQLSTCESRIPHSHLVVIIHTISLSSQYFHDHDTCISERIAGLELGRDSDGIGAAW